MSNKLNKDAFDSDVFVATINFKEFSNSYSQTDVMRVSCSPMLTPKHQAAERCPVFVSITSRRFPFANHMYRPSENTNKNIEILHFLLESIVYLVCLVRNHSNAVIKLKT